MSTSDPLKTLMLFHRSVRAALDAFDALVAAAEAGRVDEYKAAALHEFFAGPMHWHDYDERESVLKPLARADATFAGTVDDAVREHEQLEAIVDRILDHLAAIVRRSEWPETAVLRTAARELRGVLTPHLEREERELFPAARARLDAASLARIDADIEARRAAREAARIR